MRSVCVFCGSSLGTDPVYRQAATEFGRHIGNRRIRLIYGGGNIGLMGTVADAALAAGGEVVGVIPKALAEKELSHSGLTELLIVDTMHERKARMAERSDAFVALPGGFGTFEEFCEVLTWTQLGVHSKPCGLLNVNGFYDSLLTLFDRAVVDRFVRPEHRLLVLAETTSEAIIDALMGWKHVHTDKWLDRSSV